MKLSFRNLTIVVPPLEQFLQWFAHLTYIFLGIYVIELYRVPSYYFLCLAICGFAELVIGYFRSNRQSIKIPITGFISAGTFYLFVESLQAQVYILGSIAAVASKYLVRFNNKHVFNPGNIAVLFVVILLPQYAVSVPGQWGGDLWLIAVVGLIGALVSALAKRIWAALAYLTFFVLFSCIRAAIYDISPVFLAGAAIGVPSMIFAFHMLTDPMTSPARKIPQIVYGAIIALFDVLLRFFEILYAPIIALVLVTALRPVVHLVKEHHEKISSPNDKAIPKPVS